jgi:hypothetical protein
METEYFFYIQNGGVDYVFDLYNRGKDIQEFYLDVKSTPRKDLLKYAFQWFGMSSSTKIEDRTCFVMLSFSFKESIHYNDVLYNLDSDTWYFGEKFKEKWHCENNNLFYSKFKSI